jgi:hypothetical protein
MKTLYTTDKNFMKEIQKYVGKDEYSFMLYSGKYIHTTSRINFVAVNMYVYDTGIETGEVSLFDKEYDYIDVTKIEIERKTR